MSEEAKLELAARKAETAQQGKALDALADRMAEVHERLEFEAKARLALVERLDEHGKKLTNYGLTSEARITTKASLDGRTRIMR